MENDMQTVIKKQNIGIRCFSSNALKVIACISMLIDHIGIVFADGNPFMRAAGRLAFPVFAFLLVQGLLHTSNVWRYLGRLVVFALLSEIPFDLVIHDSVWYTGAQNIFFTLALGLFVVYTFETTGVLRGWAAEIAVISAFGAEFLRFDYGMAGIGIILLFYWCEKEKTADRFRGGGKTYFDCRENIKIILISTMVYVLCLGVKQLYALLALIPVNMYSGRRGKLKLKYVFYLFYPIHLLLIWIIWKNNC